MLVLSEQRPTYGARPINLGLSVGQKKQLEDVTLDSGTL